MPTRSYADRNEKSDPIRNTRTERTFHGMDAILERHAHIRKVRRDIKQAKVKQWPKPSI